MFFFGFNIFPGWIGLLTLPLINPGGDLDLFGRPSPWLVRLALGGHLLLILPVRLHNLPGLPGACASPPQVASYVNRPVVFQWPCHRPHRTAIVC